MFNRDELAAQTLAGGGPRVSGIRDFMPDQHRLFFAQLPYIFIGAIDSAGWPLATVLTGQPGFVRAPDQNTLHISALPSPEDPVHAALVPERDIGILGIDLATRRRNRANGRILSRDDDGIAVTVAQSFGNCPQYIHRRDISAMSVPAAKVASASHAEAFDGLDPAASATIADADTFFVASRSRPGEGSSFGADISHRGGPRGFVQTDRNTLTIPDFRGNRYFNTLGNLMADPRAALLFVQFDSGDLLQLQGSAEVDWNGANEYAGAKRVWRLHVTRTVRRRAALQLRWVMAQRDAKA